MSVAIQCGSCDPRSSFPRSFTICRPEQLSNMTGSRTMAAAGRGAQLIESVYTNE